MNAMHDEILATIERRGLADGVPLVELDDHVADVLGIPPDHFAAWQLTSGAITTFAHAHGLVDADLLEGTARRPEAATVAGQLRRLWEHLGALHHAATSCPDPTAVRSQARELIGELFVLTDWLLTDADREAVGASHG